MLDQLQGHYAEKNKTGRSQKITNYSMYIIFLKLLNYKDQEQISACQGTGTEMSGEVGWE